MARLATLVKSTPTASLANKALASYSQLVSAAAEKWDTFAVAEYGHPAVPIQRGASSVACWVVIAAGRGAHMCGVAAMFLVGQWVSKSKTIKILKEKS